jgi:hypothetical protein
MNIGLYGILFVFGAFILLLIRNPKMSCFGRKLKSPFYPLLKRKKMAREAELLKKERRQQLKTTDYGFRLNDEDGVKPAVPPEAQKKAKDYGFKLD